MCGEVYLSRTNILRSLCPVVLYPLFMCDRKTHSKVPRSPWQKSNDVGSIGLYRTQLCRCSRRIRLCTLRVTTADPGDGTV